VQGCGDPSLLVGNSSNSRCRARDLRRAESAIALLARDARAQRAQCHDQDHADAQAVTIASVVAPGSWRDRLHGIRTGLEHPQRCRRFPVNPMANSAADRVIPSRGIGWSSGCSVSALGAIASAVGRSMRWGSLRSGLGQAVGRWPALGGGRARGRACAWPHESTSAGGS
jgi:hypothetical protein